MAYNMDDHDDIEEAEDGFDFLPIQQHSRPISRMSGDLIVPTVHIDDTDIDENLIAVARNLGIEIPEEPVERKAETSSPNISAVTVSSGLQEPSILQSRNSASTRPTSIGSNEDYVAPEPSKPTHIPIESLMPAEIPLPPSRAPSVAPSRAPSVAPSRTTSYSRAPSIAPSTVAESVTSTSRSIFSTSNRSKHSSIASSFTKSLRRLSGLSRKSSSAESKASKETVISIQNPGLIRGRTASTPQLYRPSSSGGITLQPQRSSSTLSAPMVNLPPQFAPQRSIGSVLPSYAETRHGRSSMRRPLTPTIEEEDFEELRIAQERSLRNSHLQKLRTSQLEEQAKFMQEHYTKQRKSKDEAKYKFKKAQDIYEKRKDETILKHEAANSELESKHLHAEMELERLLSSQRKACETKLKYMEAYCNGKRDAQMKINAEDERYPVRKVTEEDYKKLVEQYHLRNGMDTLHRSRINVLREQQAQQATKISFRQDGELEGLSCRHDREMGRLRTEADRVEQDQKREYTNRKLRMIWRWNVKEAIERRRLELDRGVVFGQLPSISWPDEQKEKEDKIMTALSQGQRFSFLMS